ncbi:MAG: MarC family protein [Puniceicoccales bacterium]|nr:MarC family protein [Puniceicoccales bacterium]
MVGSCANFMSHFGLFGDSVLRLLGAINPLSVAVLFLASFGRYGFRQRRSMARTASAVAFFLLLAFVWWGDSILAILGIGVPSIYIAGGIILAVIGSKFLCSTDSDEIDGESQVGPVEFSKDRPNMAVIPLAIPLIVGGGQVAAAVDCGKSAVFFCEKLIVALAVAVAIAITLIALSVASFLCAFLSSTLEKLFFRIGGLVILAIAFQHILRGLEGMEPFCNMICR